MLTKTEAPHWLLRVAANVLCVVMWAVVGLICLLAIAGCVAVDTPPTAEEPDGGTAYALAWPAGEDGQPDTEGFPLWAKIAVAAATAFAAPRTRRNLVGAAAALMSGEVKRAGIHVAAGLTPFWGSPPEALPKAQREAIVEVSAGATA
jgi:hypothetical protein